MAFESKPIQVKPAKQTRKEYAEKPFDFYTLKQSNLEITIEESLDFENDKPRVIKVKNFKKEGEHEAIAIRVTDGMFTKDLHMREDEWTKLCAAFPSTLVNLRGVTFKVLKGQDFDVKIEYLRVARQDGDGNQYNSGNPKNLESQPAINNTAMMLHSGLTFNKAMGKSNDAKEVIAIAERLNPGNALGLIKVAKDLGLIIENKGEYTAIQV